MKVPKKKKLLTPTWANAFLKPFYYEELSEGIRWESTAILAEIT
jgi:hypothetical protein